MEQALKLLPALQRELIVKHVVDGESYSQLAKEHSLSKATVGYHVKKGLLKMRMHLGDERKVG